MNKFDTVLISVGTTKFDPLIEVIDNRLIQEKLFQFGAKKLIVQHGSSSVPSSHIEGLIIESFNRTNDMSPYLSQSTIMISHAGAGCILDAREFKLPHVIVVNDSLMNNHQKEIAEKIEKENSAAVFYSAEKLEYAILNGTFLDKINQISDKKNPKSRSINEVLDELFQ